MRINIVVKLIFETDYNIYYQSLSGPEGNVCNLTSLTTTSLQLGTTRVALIYRTEAALRSLIPFNYTTVTPF